MTFNRHIVWDVDDPARPKSDGGEVGADTGGDDFREVPLGVRGPNGVSMRNEDREFNYSSQTSDMYVMFATFQMRSFLDPACHC